MSKLLEGKVAVVTGGTRGIGYAIVKTYLQQGAKVVLCGSREQTAKAALEKLHSELGAVEVEAIWPELSEEKAVKEAFDAVKSKFGSLDILANNAGISQNCPLDKYTEEEVDKILNINIKSVFVCAKVAAAIMKEQGGGVIINASSMVSFNGQPVCVNATGAPGARDVDLSGADIDVLVDLGTGGDGTTTVWTTDLSHDYVHINSAYSS